MAEKNFVADKPTLDATKVIVEDIQTKINQMDTSNLANKSDIKEISDKVGLSSATGGSTTTGTLMAKSNAILTDTATLKKNQTGLHNDLQELATQIIGADPTATGGSTTTGNVIAKENAILSNIGESTDSETTDTLYGKTNCIINKEDNLKMLGLTTDGKVDNILSSVGATNDMWTTSSDTDGTLMAKINRLIYRIGDPDDTIDNGTVLGRVSSGVIRNYQSGVIVSLPTKIILEGFTDINKMLIILNGGEIKIGVVSNTRYGVFSPVIWSTYSNSTLQLSSLELSATSETARDTYVSYQVIEFY